MTRWLILAAVILAAHPVEGQINTTGWEDSPFVSLDGSRLLFMYNPWSFWPVHLGGQPVYVGPDRPGHVSDPNPWDDSNVYLATRRQDGTWTAPEPLLVGCCAMQIEPLTIYLQEGKPSNPGDRDIVLRRWNGSRWAAQSLGAGLNSTSMENNPHALAGGSVIYFESNRPGGYGGYDLYRAQRSCVLWWCRWSVSNLGPTVNTADDEQQAWVNPDETWLVYNRTSGVFTQHARATASDPWGPGVPLDFGVPAAEVSFCVWHGVLEAYYMAVDFAAEDIILSRSVWDGARWVLKGPVGAQ